MTDTTSVLGYAWPLIVSAGEKIAFHLSSATLKGADAALGRVRWPDPDPAGPGLRLAEMQASIDGELRLSHQPLLPGSCAVIPDAPALGEFQSFTVGAFVWPTMPGDRAQTLVSRWRDDLGGGVATKLAAGCAGPECVADDAVGHAAHARPSEGAISNKYRLNSPASKR